MAKTLYFLRFLHEVGLTRYPNFRILGIPRPEGVFSGPVRRWGGGGGRRWEGEGAAPVGRGPLRPPRYLPN